MLTASALSITFNAWRKNNEKMIKQVLVETEKQFNYVIGREDVKDIIISADSFSDENILKLVNKINSAGKNAFLRLERITRKSIPPYDAYDNFLNDNNIKGFLVENIDSFNRLIASKTNKIIELDYTMNVWNEETKAVYENLVKSNEIGKDDAVRNFTRLQFTYPIELSAYDMLKLHMDTLVVYSDLSVMVSANCIEKTEGRCQRLIFNCDAKDDRKAQSTTLVKRGYITDRKNAHVPYKAYCKYCYNKIFNPDFYYIADILKKDDNLKKLKYKKIRYEFSLIEDEKKIADILDGALNTNNNAKNAINFTRGHIKKSIE